MDPSLDSVEALAQLESADQALLSAAEVILQDEFDELCPVCEEQTPQGPFDESIAWSDPDCPAYGGTWFITLRRDHRFGYAFDEGRRDK